MTVSCAKIVQIDGANRQISRGQNELTTELAGSWPKKSLHFGKVGATRQRKSHIVVTQTRLLHILWNWRYTTQKQSSLKQ
jgi:hypothetical protein